MFSLIITLISVALVVALAMATMYYLSSGSLNAAATEAVVTRLTNETSQIQSAIEFYRAEHRGALPTSLADLTQNGTYLKQLPSGAWQSNVAFIQTAAANDVTESVCIAFNKKRNIPFVPSCSDQAFKSVIMCCDEGGE